MVKMLSLMKANELGTIRSSKSTHTHKMRAKVQFKSYQILSFFKLIFTKDLESIQSFHRQHNCTHDNVVEKNNGDTLRDNSYLCSPSVEIAI